MVPGGSKLSPGSSYTDMICARDLFSYWAAMTVQNAIGGDLTQATRNAEGRDIEFVMDVRTAWQLGQLFDRLFNAVFHAKRYAASVCSTVKVVVRLQRLRT